MNDALNLLKTRRSIRKYKDQPVEEEKIEKEKKLEKEMKEKKYMFLIWEIYLIMMKIMIKQI